MKQGGLGPHGACSRGGRCDGAAALVALVTRNRQRSPQCSMRRLGQLTGLTGPHEMERKGGGGG
jgi:hypothetical protein